MNFRVETVKAADGAKAELATLTHEGREFTAFGSCVDLGRGHIVAYVRTGHGHLHNKYFDLVTFGGRHMGVLKKTGESTGWPDRSGRRSKITHFSFEAHGYRWSGKLGLEWNQLIHLRRGKKLS